MRRINEEGRLTNPLTRGSAGKMVGEYLPKPENQKTGRKTTTKKAETKFDPQDQLSKSDPPKDQPFLINLERSPGKQAESGNAA